MFLLEFFQSKLPYASRARKLVFTTRAFRQVKSLNTSPTAFYAVGLLDSALNQMLGG